MNRIKHIIAVCAVFGTLCSASYAGEMRDLGYKITVCEDEVTVAEESLVSDIDNSNLEVNVIKQQGGTKTTIFKGKLKDYDSGMWVHTDFSEIRFLIVFDWNGASDEAIYIIPINTERNMGEISGCADNITNVSGITYDVAYTVSNENMNILYSVNNTTNTTQNVDVISVLYKNGILQRVISEPFAVNAGAAKSGSITMILPETGREQCSVKMMVLENENTLRPLGKSKTVKDIEPYLREKTAVISANDGQEFKLYMNSENVIGNNIEADHIIKFNPHKFEVIDLCGLTYEKELVPGKIENTGIAIQSIDTQNGKIIFNFDLPEGRNNGINNIVRFKALSGASGEEIIYEIQ